MNQASEIKARWPQPLRRAGRRAQVGGGHLLWVARTHAEPPACPAQVVEVEAFCSVQDMIHAAIASYGAQASLREVLNLCRTCPSSGPRLPRWPCKVSKGPALCPASACDGQCTARPMRMPPHRGPAGWAG